MAFFSPDGSVDKLATHLIQRKARQLIRQGFFPKSDCDDLEQELRIHLWQQIGKFNPDLGHWNAFLTTVLERHAATFVRRCKARKNGSGQTISLSELVDNGEGELEPLERTLKQEDLDRRRQSSSLSGAEAAKLGMPRSTLYERIGRLRGFFIEAGLNKTA